MHLSYKIRTLQAPLIALEERQENVNEAVAGAFHQWKAFQDDACKLFAALFCGLGMEYEQKFAVARKSTAALCSRIQAERM